VLLQVKVLTPAQKKLAKVNTAGMKSLSNFFKKKYLCIHKFKVHEHLRWKQIANNKTTNLLFLFCAFLLIFFFSFSLRNLEENEYSSEEIFFVFHEATVELQVVATTGQCKAHASQDGLEGVVIERSYVWVGVDFGLVWCPQDLRARKENGINYLIPCVGTIAIFWVVTYWTIPPCFTAVSFKLSCAHESHFSYSWKYGTGHLHLTCMLHFITTQNNHENSNLTKCHSSGINLSVASTSIRQ